MLPSENRLRRPAEFRAVIGAGERARRGCLVVHYAADFVPGPSATGLPVARVGFVVGRTVGSSVVRHQVTRRLRAQLRARLYRLPPGSGTVVRALAGADAADSAAFARDLDAALTRLLPRVPPASPADRADRAGSST